MKYNPNFHHRRSVRLKGYDYSKSGLYFITICCFKRACFFGEIISKCDKKMMSLNESGRIVNETWFEIPLHFPNVSLHEFVVMPNHIHGIIEIINSVGAENLPPNYHSHVDIIRENVYSPLQRHPAEFKSPSKTIGSIIRGYKIGVTKWHRANTDIYNVWQRSFHDHIIRNEKSYLKISNYINNNPDSWGDDTFFKK